MEEKIKYWDYNKQEYRLRKKPTRKPTYNDLQQEITQLEEQLDECKEFASTYERELLAIIKFKDIEITKLKEQISKAIEYNNENIKRINERTFGVFDAISKEAVKKELEVINKILEINKED